MIMPLFRHRFSPTPRRFAVGLFVCAIVVADACHRQAPPPPPAPVRRPAPPTPKSPAEVAIADAPSLVRAMHARYAETWYHTITFVQKTTVGLPSGGDLVETWYEAGELPGRLRIDTDLEARSGLLFAGDSIYHFNAGKLVSADTGVNDLLLLGFDVYKQPPARTDAMLRHLGFDLSRMHETTWHGRPVYVVGALRGDTVSKQFWIDRERLLFVRLLEHTSQGRTDVRFDDYVPSNGGWVAERVEQFTNGKRRVLEQYSNVRTNVSLSGTVFDPHEWSSGAHWSKR